ncbi:uncharacterized protein LOC131613026 [Vicia villosa]|uniref:uncharacterized protein LOC131613026 n=1 Tax=Vicia villosa TaxID=3911 RepID=UPI00273CE4A5|nr:uncharacterized protein LOC131613026 [Vicia villosa]
MESSMKLGMMAVFAVSGSMVLLAHQVHKRMLSNFMKQFEIEMGGNEKHNEAKKKVRFAKKMKGVSMENKSSNNNNRDERLAQRVKAEQVWVIENALKSGCVKKLEDTMPPNRAVLYRGIMNYRHETSSGRIRF